MKQAPVKYALLLLVVLAVGMLAYIRLHGFSARDEPGAAEAFVARRLRSFAMPSGARELVNPVALSPEVLRGAMEHFADHCAFCHSNNGSGDNDIGKGLYPKPPDMRQAATQNLRDGELYYIIRNGVRFTGMPAFGADAQSEDNWKLVHFIRHLPRITDEELAQMKEMNPKSPADLEEEDEIRKFLEGGESHTSDKDHKH